MSSLIDWDVAAGAAKRFSPAPPATSRQEADQAVGELYQATARAAGHVAEITHLHEPPVTAVTRVIDRAAWIDANTGGMRAVTQPLVEKLSESNPVGRVAETIGGRVTGVQAGAMLAFLSSAILGQYDPFTGADGTLLLVAPNIVSVERTLGVRPADFRLWVCLHEVTHRVQFSAVPWLAGYLRETVATLTEASTEPFSEVLGRLADELRERRAGSDESGLSAGGVVGLLRATQGPAQRNALDRILVLGTLLEGHADHVMDAVGPAVVPTVADIRKAFDERRKRPQNPLQRLLRALLGMDAKLAQYVRGKAFVDAVVERVGMERFNTIWTDPSTLPLPAEVEKPEAWIARVLD